MIDSLGWLATAVFATSYVSRDATTMRRIQGLAACLWAGYGALIHSLPLIVANLIVAGAAVTTSFRKAVPAGDS